MKAIINTATAGVFGAVLALSALAQERQQTQPPQAGQQQQQQEAGMPKVGQQVQISDARVIRKQSDRVFWIESKGEKTPVLLSRQAAQGAQLKEGDRIQITGMVGPVPQNPQDLPIDEQLAKELQKEQKFIFATQVQETPPAGGGTSGAQQQGQQPGS